MFVQYNLSDHTKQSGTRGKKVEKEKKKNQNAEYGKKSPQGLAAEKEWKQQTENGFLHIALPPSSSLCLFLSPTWFIMLICTVFASWVSPPALQRSWNAHTHEYKHKETLNVNARGTINIVNDTA